MPSARIWLAGGNPSPQGLVAEAAEGCVGPAAIEEGGVHCVSLTGGQELLLPGDIDIGQHDLPAIA